MEMNKIMEMITYFITTYSLKVVGAILIFIIGKWLARYLSKLLGKILRKNNMDETLTSFLGHITYYTLFLLVLIAAAGQLGINTTSFLTIVGAAGLAVGLALKDSLSNFASGIMLIMFRPFKVGDYVTAGGQSGTVESIAIFNTVLKTPDNQIVIVPNSSITADVITNVNAKPTRRIDLVVGIGYDDNISEAKSVLEDLIKADNRILSDPAPTIAVSELADSSVNFVVRPWVKTEDYWAVRLDLIEKIKLTFDEKGISFPYPQQDVHMYTETASD
ncbi:MAG: mechanosensitive ion channel [Deltaproteobacteria bacterium]|nr:mechanosensitive ion channel [Deltaproteobacteria bacterium]MBW2563469.1 mechanosensitive ion channel [Deltaproteobacteria bacterium]